MDSVSAVFGGLGILGVAVILVLAWALLALLPIWAIIDCSNSNRGRARAGS